MARKLSIIGKPKKTDKPKIKPAKRAPTEPQQKFIENVVAGKNHTDAYADAFPKSARNSAGSNAARLMRDDTISKEITRRKNKAARNANITTAQVLGATAMIAFADIRDAHDPDGYFDYKKAVKTGAVALIRKMTRTNTRYGENVSVEFYSKKDALDRLGDYLGMRQKGAADGDELVKLRQIIEQSAEKSGIAYSEELKYFVENFSGLYKPELINKLASELEN